MARWGGDHSRWRQGTVRLAFGQTAEGRIVSIRDVLGFLAERLWAERDEAAHDTARALLDRR